MRCIFVGIEYAGKSTLVKPNDRLLPTSEIESSRR